MPGDIASVLLSTSPPMFSTSPRLNFDVVSDVTKSYFARFAVAAHCAVAAETVPGSVPIVGAESLSLSLSPSSAGSSLADDMESTLSCRCLSDSEVQRSWHLASAVFQRHARNRSDPSLNTFTCFASESNSQNSLFGISLQKNCVSDSFWSTDNNTTVSQSQSQSYSLIASDASKTVHDDSVQQDSTKHGLIRVDTYKLAVNQATDTEKSVTPTVNEAPTETATPKRSLNKKGRCVRFADELGKSLNAIRVIENLLSIGDTEYASGVESGKTDGRCGSDARTRYNPLVVEFAQPVSDYSRFREKLERNNVSLENVLINGYRVSGTVRVRNVSFEKRVYVRVTTDRWASYTDHYATFVANSNEAGCQASPKMYDSFAFDLGDLSNKLTLYTNAGCGGKPGSSPQQRVEMAVCFVSGSQSFWDNNNGRNYTVVYVPPEARGIGERQQKMLAGYTSTYRPDFSAFQDNFTEFTAWNHYDSYNPYY